MVNLDVYKRSLAERVSLNSQILKNKYWYLPVDDKGHLEFSPVGRSVKTSDWCSKFRGLSVCKDKDAHKGHFLNGVDCTNKFVSRIHHFWCKKSSCPVCFIRGWAVRGAKYLVGRLDKASKEFGSIEHVVCSVPKCDYDLPYKVMRNKAVEILKSRGVFGGSPIFHGYRVDDKRGVLVWSPHFHVLGFVEGGYKCWSCKRKNNCLKGCGGFDDRSYNDGFLKDGYIVKVLPKRKTVFGTAWYQLHHATIKVGIERFHVFTWFGVCAYRNFKRSDVASEVPCPVCDGAMVKAVYVGKRRIVKDLGDEAYVPFFVDDEFDEDGHPNFVDSIGSRVE